MKEKTTLIIANFVVLILIGLSMFGLTTVYKQQKSAGQTLDSNDKYAYLTTVALRSLPPLPETNRIIPTGRVKEITLEAKETEWELLPGVKTLAYTYNGQTPGPVIRVTEGDLVSITLRNSLKLATSIHFHGMHIPNNMDGVPAVTQQEVLPGKSFTYQFIAGHAGTYMYHPHVNTVEQIDNGLYGAFVIDPQQTEGQPVYNKDITMVFGGWNVPADSYDPAALQNKYTSKNDGSGQDAMAGMDSSGTDGTDSMAGMDGMSGMDSTGTTDTMSGMEGMTGADGTGSGDTAGTGASGGMNMNYNFWTINGKAFPANEVIKAKKGERIRIRMVNPTNFAHPIHIHGGDFRVIAEDSHPLAQPRIMNTLDVAPGKTFDIDLIADNPGKWVFHCHELHHAENDGVEPGGLMGIIQVT